MDYAELYSKEDLWALIKHHNTHSEYVVLDIETTGLNPHKDQITDIIITGYNEESVVLFKPNLALELNRLDAPIVAHNFRFDFNFLHRVGVELKLHADAMLLDHLLDENAEHGLDAIVQRRYNDNYKEVFWETYKEYKDAPKEAQIEYACKDVYYTGKVYRDISRALEERGIPSSLLSHVKSLAQALYKTEIAGIKLDLPYLAKMGDTLSTRITALKEEMRKEVDIECTILENKAYETILNSYKTDKGRAKAKPPEPFNWDSSAQLPTLLYGQLNLPVQINPKRKPTCDDKALSNIEHLHPVLPLLREYRGHQKIYGSFIEGSLEKMYQGRIYPSFNVNGTVTGRISSSGPNMQQLPTEGGVRGIYIPDEGYKFISCDYSQLEVVIAAHYSKDKALLSIIYDGASQHDITANGLGIPRQQAKTINFALQYGAGARKIQSILSCSKQEAEEALNKYWETYAGLRDFVKDCHAKVDRGEDLINLFGRRRRLRIPEGANHWQIEALKRQAPSSIIQGSGGDLTNRAFYLVNDALRTKGLGKALFTIHDEVLITVKDNPNALQEASSILTSTMELVGKEVNLTVPLKAQVSKPTERWSK